MSEIFKFSIIISLFESQSYLEETIESIVNQTLNFKENIQIIFVDNESQDRSLNTVQKYKNTYPENIIVLSKNNEGLASSRNFALEYIEGEYVNFMDANDKLSSNSLRNVYNNFKKNEERIDIVSLPIFLLSDEKEDYVFKYDYNGRKVIDLFEETKQSIIPFKSSFIKSKLIKNNLFNENLVNSSEKLVLYKILFNKKAFAVDNDSVYFFRNENLDTRFTEETLTKRDFTEKLKLFFIPLIDHCRDEKNKVPFFIQNILLYEITPIIQCEEISDYLDTKEEIGEFWMYLTKISKIFDEEFVFYNRRVINSVKSFLIYLKNDDFHIEIDHVENEVKLMSGDYVINNLNKNRIHFDIVDLYDGMLNFSGGFTSSCYNKNISIVAIKTDNKGKKSTYEGNYLEYPTTGRKSKKHLGIWWSFYYNFDLSIPIEPEEKCEISFRVIYHENDERIVMENSIHFREFPGISILNNYFIKYSKIVYFRVKTFYIQPFSYKRMIELEAKSIIRTLRMGKTFRLYGIFYRILRFILFPFMRNKKIWLFIDRDTFADDNAEHLFKYSIKQNDEIKKYFIINKDSPDFERLKEYDKNIVPFGSFKHRILYLFTDKLISSQITKSLANPFIKKNSFIYEGLSKHDFCFIQHGVTLHDVSSWIRKYNRNMLLFVTSSDLERDSIVNGHYNYSKDVVQTLGMARYDNLVNDAKKEILFMPTWRRKINTKDQLKNSHYFKFLNSFLNNKELIEYAEKKGYKLAFRPHPQLWDFIDLFHIDKRIRLSTEPYQEMFRDASVMITDYSSVFFDFAYLKKPVIYYQPESFGEFHYEKGYYDYETMGFGEIIKTEEELVSLVKEYIETDCQMKEKYKKRVEKFFKYNDKNNCKRTYEWILNH